MKIGSESRWPEDWRGEEGVWFIRNEPDDSLWRGNLNKRDKYLTLAHPSLRQALLEMFALESEFAPCARDAKRCAEEKVMINCGYVPRDEGKRFYWSAALMHKDHIRAPFLTHTVVGEHMRWRPLAFGKEFTVENAYEMLDILSRVPAGMDDEIYALKNNRRGLGCLNRGVPVNDLIELRDKADRCEEAGEDFRDTFRSRCFVFFNPFTGKTMPLSGSLYEISHSMGCCVDLNWMGLDDVLLHETCRHNGFDFYSAETWDEAQMKEFQTGFAKEYALKALSDRETKEDRIYRGFHTPIAEQHNMLGRMPGDPTQEELRLQNTPVAVVKRQGAELAQRGKEFINKLTESELL